MVRVEAEFMRAVLRAAAFLGVLAIFFSGRANGEDAPKRRWYRDLNARRISELQRQLVSYKDVKFDSELYETRSKLERELRMRQNNSSWRVQSDYGRITFTGKHAIPGWVKRFREFGDDIEFDPPINPEEAIANRASNQARYEAIYTAQKTQVTANNTKWESDWNAWEKNVQERLDEWWASCEKGLKEYGEPLVAEVVRPRIEAFKKQLVEGIAQRKSELKAQKAERSTFISTQMDPYYRDLVALGLDIATFEAELIWVQGQEIKYYTEKYSNPFFAWWGTQTKPGIDATWKSFEIDKVLAEEAKVFAPYKTVRDRFLETYKTWESTTITAHIPWWPTLPAEDRAWHTESVKKLSGEPDHIRLAVEKDIDAEFAARTRALEELKKIEKQSLAARQGLLDQISEVVKKAYFAKSDPSGMQPEITRLWMESKDSFIPDFIKMRDDWTSADGEAQRRKLFPGTAVLIDREVGRYPLHIKERGSPYVYHVELDKAVTTLRYEQSDREKILFEFMGKRSFRAIGDDAILITGHIRLLDAKLADKLEVTPAELETENPKGWAIRLHGDEIVEVLDLVDENLSWGAVKRMSTEKGKAADKLAVLFLDARQALVNEFGLVIRLPGTKKIGSLGGLEAQPELWDRPQK